MDHLDKFDYALLGCSVAGFLFCVIAIWRPRPYLQLEAKFQRYEPYAPSRTDKGGRHGKD